MLVTYSSINGGEILVCQKKDEKKLLKQYFNLETGRDMDEYDRQEHENIVEITSPLKVW